MALHRSLTGQSPTHLPCAATGVILNFHPPHLIPQSAALPSDHSSLPYLSSSPFFSSLPASVFHAADGHAPWPPVPADVDALKRLTLAKAAFTSPSGFRAGFPNYARVIDS